MSRAPRLVCGLVGDNAGNHALEARKPDHYVAGKRPLYFKKFSIVHNLVDDLVDVESLLGSLGDDFVELGVVGLFKRRGEVVRGLLHIVGRQVGEEL